METAVGPVIMDPGNLIILITCLLCEEFGHAMSGDYETLWNGTN